MFMGEKEAGRDLTTPGMHAVSLWRQSLLQNSSGKLQPRQDKQWAI